MYIIKSFVFNKNAKFSNAFCKNVFNFILVVLLTFVRFYTSFISLGTVKASQVVVLNKDM